MENILHPEWDKYRKALCCKCSERINLSCSKRHYRIESIYLLKSQCCKLAKMFSCCGKQRFRIILKLFLTVCRNNHCDNSKHHSLVTGRKVIEELFHFFLLLLHIIRNGGREVIIGILPTLPVCNIGFHTKQTVFCFLYCFISRNRNNINRHHQISVHIRKFRYHTVLDIGRIFTKKKDSSITVSHLEIVLFKFHCVGADIILKIVSLFSCFLNIKVERAFFSHTIEVVENTKSFVCFQFHTLTSKPAEVSNQICTDTGKISSCVLHTLFVDGNGNILILNNGVCTRCLIKKHFVVFLSILVQIISGCRNKDCLLKIQSVEPTIIDCDFCRCTTVKRVQKFGIFKEHRFLILTARHCIVNIRKAISL